MTKSEERLLQEVHKQMTRRNHKLPSLPKLAAKGSMFIYEACEKCNLSIYNYSQLDSPVCSKP